AHRCLLGHVGDHGETAPAQVARLSRHGFGRLGFEVDDRDIGTFAGEQKRDRLAKARGGTGHDGYFAVELAHLRLPLGVSSSMSAPSTSTPRTRSAEAWNSAKVSLG